MKTRTINITALALLPAALFTLTSCSSTPKPPPPEGSARITYTKGVPGGTIVQTFKTTATATAVDHANRTATLQEYGGKTFVVKVGPAAINFDQVHVGDQVIATVTQKIVAHFDKKSTAPADGSAAVVDLAGKGDQPGGLVAETTQLTGQIFTINAEERTATVQFTDGSAETLPIRRDVDLSRLTVGQKVVFRVTEMIALNVEKAQ